MSDETDARLFDVFERLRQSHVRLLVAAAELDAELDEERREETGQEKLHRYVEGMVARLPPEPPRTHLRLISGGRSGEGEPS